MKSFEELISEAEAWELKGWDFSSLGDRWVDSHPPWNYKANVRKLLQESDSLLDMGTGGGEFLSSLTPLPKNTFATEGYPPNVPIARERLEPLNVEVIHTYSEDNSKSPQVGSLPFQNNYFDLVINRHESFVASEVFRVLRPKGTFITQQIGSDNLLELNRLLGAESQVSESWNLDIAIVQLKRAGFHIKESGSTLITTLFKDVGAVICCLKALPWQIPDFSVKGYTEALRKLDQKIRRDGELKVHASRFFIEASK